MEKHGVIVRHLVGFRLPDCVRISVGTPHENEEAIQAMADVLDKVPQVV
jgi:histidinol-phosphate/aromatic aminotransferase/cobyric acid decarboxylase-like protein